MSRSIRDLRELICLSRFGFRSEDTTCSSDDDNKSADSVLFYFDPSILNNWLDLTSSRLDKLRLLSTTKFIDFVHFWLKQFDGEHKQSLFKMELELFSEHLLLAFTPNDIDPMRINQFARQILHDIDKQLGVNSLENDYNFIRHIDVLNLCKRNDHYRTLLADLPSDLTLTNESSLHLQWMLAIRAFGLLAICTASVEFFEKIQKTLEYNIAAGESHLFQVYDQNLSNNPSDQFRHRILIALRKGYTEVIEYFVQTNQLTGECLDEQQRNVLFHALPMGNYSMIEHLLKANLAKLDINALAESGNSLVHLCVSLQRADYIELLVKYYPNINLDQRNKQDATALHLAIIYNDLESIRCLVKMGSDAKLTMKDKTCLELAREFNHDTLVEYFLQLI